MLTHVYLFRQCCCMQRWWSNRWYSVQCDDEISDNPDPAANLVAAEPAGVAIVTQGKQMRKKIVMRRDERRLKKTADILNKTIHDLYWYHSNFHLNLEWLLSVLTRSSAVAVIAVRTAYDILYRCRALSGIAWTAWTFAYCSFRTEVFFRF